MTVERWRVEFDGGPMEYAILRAIPITDGTVSEIIECGPVALWRGYPVFTRTVHVGQRPIMFIQGKWRMVKAKVKSVESVNARNHGVHESKRSGKGSAGGRDGAIKSDQRTGRAVAGATTSKASRPRRVER